MNGFSCKPPTPAPAFAGRFGEVVDKRRGAEFQELRSENLLNRLSGTAMPFGWTVNPFRGCEVGCRYCYARPTHEYLGHADPNEFEERIYVKRAGNRNLVASLLRARETGQEIAIGTATDPYQPAEGRFAITRSVLEAMEQVPGLRIGLTTKSTGVLRDREILGRLARSGDLWVNVSLISLDTDLLRQIEPRAPRPDLRLEAVRALTAEGIRTRIFLMPVLPLLTDGDAGLRELLAAALAAGAREIISQPLFLRTEMTWRFFLEFVRAEFPWALPRYRELFPRPGNAPAAYRQEIERRVSRLAAEVGFPARTREERVRTEAPARPRQLAIQW
jgi:DNA repair photolyase